MSVTLKLKRGTEAAIDSATLSEGEIAYSLDTKKLVVFDGQTGQKYLNSTVEHSERNSRSFVSLFGTDAQNRKW